MGRGGMGTNELPEVAAIRQRSLVHQPQPSRRRSLQHGRLGEELRAIAR